MPTRKDTDVGSVIFVETLVKILKQCRLAYVELRSQEGGLLREGSGY